MCTYACTTFILISYYYAISSIYRYSVDESMKLVNKYPQFQCDCFYIEPSLLSEGQPYNVFDISDETTYWKSTVVVNGVPQYLEFDLGILEHLHRFQMQFTQVGNVDFELQGS